MTIRVVVLFMLAAMLGFNPPPCVVTSVPAVAAPAGSAGDLTKPLSPDSLRAEIEGLKAPRVPWREIAWKSCLLEGLKEARAQSKPVLLWVFIDRPLDDARC